MRPPPFGDGNLDAACPHIKPIRQVSKGGRTPIRVAKFGDYFGTASLPTILGLIGFFAGVMALIGVSVAGWLYDTQGNFTGFLIPAALEAAGRVLFPEGKSAVRNGYCFFTGRPAMTREDGWSYRKYFAQVRPSNETDHSRPLRTDYDRVANQVVKPAPVIPENNHQEVDVKSKSRNQEAAKLPAQPRPGTVRSQDIQAKDTFAG